MKTILTFQGEDRILREPIMAKTFGKSDAAAVRKWTEERLAAGDSIREIRLGARKEFGAFNWADIIALIIETIKKWLAKK